MAQGIIKIVSPQMQNGIQRTWQNKFTGKPNYGFNIVFEDGTTGSCGSEKMVYPLTVGTLVTYEVTIMPGGTNNITKVKKVEQLENGTNGKTYNDPSTTKRIAFSMCQQIARLHFTNAGIQPRTLQEVNTLAGIYHQWVTNSIQDNDPHFRDLISRRYYALQLAVECIPFSGLGMKVEKQVLKIVKCYAKKTTEENLEYRTPGANMGNMHTLRPV